MLPTSLARYRRDRSRGQSLVEFALILPIMLLLALGIVDFARIYTTMLTIESAAREAADYGAYSSANWLPVNEAGTRDEMIRRACTASSQLADFSPSDCGTESPSISIDVEGTGDCADPDRATPCRVRTTLTHTMRLIAPFGFDFFGVRIGLPSSLTFTRDSVFAISDFEIDR